MQSVEEPRGAVDLSVFNRWSAIHRPKPLVPPGLFWRLGKILFPRLVQLLHSSGERLSTGPVL